MPQRIAVIIGAGPAGLTAAHELLAQSDIKPIVLEASQAFGGISRTVQHNGNRIDIGGHRFFSKSDRVMDWWAAMMPVQSTESSSVEIQYQGKRRSVEAPEDGPDPRQVDNVMLIRCRKSRILFLRQFFDYPLSLSLSTIRSLGTLRVSRMGLSYLRSCLRPIRNEKNLEEFLINRFGRELYLTFFKSYTEKVWGVPCNEIDASWGAQRIKGLSIRKAVVHALLKPTKKISWFRSKGDVAQKDVETSLIERFLYPKYGPGQMWETCAEKIIDGGGEIRMGYRAVRLNVIGQQVKNVVARNETTGDEVILNVDFVLSTMPVSELIRAFDDAPDEVREVSEGLVYRDFITVGLLLKRTNQIVAGEEKLTDNWIYLQEPDLTAGRLQIFNNWSPWLVADSANTWLGFEYFCSEDDELWARSDSDLKDLAIEELVDIGLANAEDVIDSIVIRVPKAYPAYFGSYDRFDTLRQWIDEYSNLFLIGRNGMHRYNNQDHSMLTAMTAVENIISGRADKSNIWEVNTERDYHENSESDSG